MMADRTMLQFDYEEAHGKVVTAVLGVSDGPVGWESIAIVISECALLIRIDENTDELTVNLEPTPKMEGPWQPIHDLMSAVGSELGWCWIGRNYLGYLDMFTLSFSGLEPQVCLCGEASNIRIRKIAVAT
ncbi:DUF6334 family protein [Sphingobium sp. H39-3-25]|uniref:DUF6334 family protein n=1 Tax=Sphingobium arseniciresistens TaxID=3030834 RepID=UPI0023BA3ADA|nr:DUF6334 family protein [Sphingobium arseniciresistens]